MCSEGGTSEDWSPDPHLKFSSGIHFLGKKWSQSSLGYPDPHLDKIRSALTEHVNIFFFLSRHVVAFEGKGTHSYAKPSF